MSDARAIPKGFLIFGILVPVALLLGLVLASPMELMSLGVVGLIVGILTLPLVLRWHYPMLVFAWNASISVFFLPGAPKLWMLLALVSISLTMLAYIMNRRIKLNHVPAVTWTLLAFMAVVALTAFIRGGIGIRALGSDTYGGKGFFLIAFAVLGYFALSMNTVPRGQTQIYLALFFLGGLTMAVSNLAFAAGPSFWWLLNIFGVDMAVDQIQADFGQGMFSRYAGIAFSMVGLYSYMLAHYGIRGVFNLERPWRLAGWVIVVGLAMVGGYRSILLLFGLIFAIQFFLEGLHRTRYFPMLCLAGVLGMVLLIPITPRLPIPVQRALSIIPFLEIDAQARYDAQASSDWRLRMWQVVWPEVPRYLLVGKGFGIDPTDLYLMHERQRRGMAQNFEAALVAGNYHNGTLSLLIPLGLPGLITFLAFLVASFKVLYRNYRYGPPELRTVNMFLLALFTARTLSFWAIYGAITAWLSVFTGIVGLSIALNRGVAAKPKPGQVIDQPD